MLFVALKGPHIGLPIDKIGLSSNNFLTAAFLMLLLLKSHGRLYSSQVVKSKLQPTLIPICLAIAATRGGLYTSATSMCSNMSFLIIWFN